MSFFQNKPAGTTSAFGTPQNVNTNTNAFSSFSTPAAQKPGPFSVSGLGLSAQPQQTGANAFGSPAQPQNTSTGGFGGFGSSNQGSGGFGQSNVQGGFGQNTGQGGFGQTTGGFGQSTGGFGQNTGGFGQGTGFGQNTGLGSGFGQNTNTQGSGAFGAFTQKPSGFGFGQQPQQTNQSGFGGGFNQPQQTQQQSGFGGSTFGGGLNTGSGFGGGSSMGGSTFSNWSQPQPQQQPQYIPNFLGILMYRIQQSQITPITRWSDLPQSDQKFLEDLEKYITEQKALGEDLNTRSPQLEEYVSSIPTDVAEVQKRFDTMSHILSLDSTVLFNDLKVKVHQCKN
jgi:hypothetical protein